MKQLFAAAALLLAVSAQAVPVHYFGEITASGDYTGSVDVNDGWINPPFGVNSFGVEHVNLWGYQATAGETLSLDFSSNDMAVGYSVYFGEVNSIDLLFGLFDNTGDIGDASYQAGSSPFFFNPFDISLVDFALEYSGLYTIIVGGRDFGGYDSYGYTMSASIVSVPEASSLLLMLTGLLGVAAMRRRKKV